MTSIDQSAVEEAIRGYTDPYLGRDLLALDAVKNLQISGGTVSMELVLGYPWQGLMGAAMSIITHALEDLPGVEAVRIDTQQKIRAHRPQRDLKPLPNVRNIIAVASGKGGVGKSTTAVNLALGLASEGARVGILDADIYGPSVGLMLGIDDRTRPETRENKYFVPIEAHGLQAMSMAFVVTDKTPMVWRGPMVSGALMQLLTQTLWDDLDYLILDMPPGTGDIQLTMAQKVPVSGSVIVTTPQDIALQDGRKGIEMFRKLDITVLGVVENMSTHICSHCGHQEPLFGSDGGARIADEYETELLAQLPLHRTIREQTDSGNPTVVAEPDSEVAMTYRDLARHAGAILSQRPRQLSGPIASVSVNEPNGEKQP
ncbi:MAG: iron-sulfur cluster carrier protein ApbC [Oleiphilaceae bacterium]|nr:iron-sulfur cluster carrier protein ApbC [Oleiphilaceae bacterium]